MNFRELLNNIDYNIDPDSLNQRSILLQSKIKEKRQELVNDISVFQDKFNGAEFSYNCRHEPFKFELDYYTENDHNFFSLIYEYFPDFEDHAFHIQEQTPLNVDNIDLYMNSLSVIQNLLKNKNQLLIDSKNFIDKQKSLLNDINNIQQEIFDIKLSISLNKIKNKYKLNKIREIFSSTHSFDVNDVLNENSDFTLKKQNPTQKSNFLCSFSFYSYKLQRKNVILNRHNVKVFIVDSIHKYFIGDYEITEEVLNKLINQRVCYKNESIKQAVELFSISPFFSYSKKINISYPELLEIFDKDIKQLNIKDF